MEIRTLAYPPIPAESVCSEFATIKTNFFLNQFQFFHHQAAIFRFVPESFRQEVKDVKNSADLVDFHQC